MREGQFVGVEGNNRHSARANYRWIVEGQLISTADLTDHQAVAAMVGLVRKYGTQPYVHNWLVYMSEARPGLRIPWIATMFLQDLNKGAFAEVAGIYVDEYDPKIHAILRRRRRK